MMRFRSKRERDSDLAGGGGGGFSCSLRQRSTVAAVDMATALILPVTRRSMTERKSVVGEKEDIIDWSV